MRSSQFSAGRLYAMPTVRELFEAELAERGVRFAADPQTGLYTIPVGEAQLTVSLDNLSRDFQRDGDVGRIARFVDMVMEAARGDETPPTANELYWALEANDHVHPPEIRSPLSDRVDRVLVRLSPGGRHVTWVTGHMLGTAGLSRPEAERFASENLRRTLDSARVVVEDVHGVKLGMLGTTLPVKASLILAPNFKQVVAPVIGWPLRAVVPNRDFLYVWDRQHVDFTSRVGQVVVDEYRGGGYPVSTEVFEIDDDGVRAIGEFPADRS